MTSSDGADLVKSKISPRLGMNSKVQSALALEAKQSSYVYFKQIWVTMTFGSSGTSSQM